MLGIDHFTGLALLLPRLLHSTITRTEVKGVVSFFEAVISLSVAITLMELLTRARKLFRINRRLSRPRALGYEKRLYR